jgi:hypothetical protein
MVKPEGRVEQIVHSLRWRLDRTWQSPDLIPSLGAAPVQNGAGSVESRHAPAVRPSIRTADSGLGDGSISMNMNRKVMACAAMCLATTIGVSSTAAAGEVTGSGKPTPISERAKSICAFSGLEDGVALIGFDENGPIFMEVPTGPGLVQNPHQENAAGIIHEPGIPGEECRGNTTSGL